MIKLDRKMASTAPATPKRCPIEDLVALIERDSKVFKKPAYCT